MTDFKSSVLFETVLSKTLLLVWTAAVERAGTAMSPVGCENEEIYTIEEGQRFRPAGVSRHLRRGKKSSRVSERRIYLLSGRGREQRHVRSERRREIHRGEWVRQGSGGRDVWSQRLFWRGMHGGPVGPHGHGNGNYPDHHSGHRQKRAAARTPRRA